MKNYLVFLSAAFLLLFVGCRPKNPKTQDTPTSGTLVIAADEALKPIVDAEISAFNALYSKAHITAFYVSEAQALDTLLKDSVRLAFATRKLTASEEEELKKNHFRADQSRVAIGGIALIVNNENPDTLLTVDQLQAILKGEIKNWNQITKSSKGEISVVFDHPNSGMIRFLKDSLFKIPALPANCFATDSNAAVVDYVSKNPNAVGLIDISWISDGDDATTNKFMNAVKVMGISNGGEYFQPFQAYISLKKYPLLRDVVMISREGRSGLATGFMRFVASDKGQRIILKSGLVPATMPVRIVEINRNPL